MRPRMSGYWRQNIGKLRNLLNQGYRLSTDLDVFLAAFPGKSYDSLQKVIRRYLRDVADEDIQLGLPGICQPENAEGQTFSDTEIEDSVTHDINKFRVQNAENFWKRKCQILLRQHATYENLLDFFRDSLAALPPVPYPHPVALTPGAKQAETMVLQLSDIHWGDRVVPKTIIDLGDYDAAMARGRIAFMVEKTLLIKSENTRVFNKLNIHILGDIVAGYIHEELRENGDGKIVQWVIEASICLALAILELSREFPVVEVWSVPGNHGRMDQKVKFKDDAISNFDIMVYEMMSILLQDQPNIVFHIPRSYYAIASVCGGWNSLLTHGQFIRSNLSIPAYGVQRAASRMSELINLQYLKMNPEDTPTVEEMFSHSFRYMELGHFHTLMTLNTNAIEIFMNGSVVGNSEYNIAAMAAGQDPRQWLLFAHPDEGYTGRYPLNLTKATRQMGNKYKVDPESTAGENFRRLKEKM
jgi:hypothetical protein